MHGGHPLTDLGIMRKMIWRFERYGHSFKIMFTLPQWHNMQVLWVFLHLYVGSWAGFFSLPLVGVGCKHAQRFLTPITPTAKPSSVLNLSFHLFHSATSLRSKADLSQTRSLLPDLRTSSTIHPIRVPSLRNHPYHLLHHLLQPSGN